MDKGQLVFISRSMTDGEETYEAPLEAAIFDHEEDMELAGCTYVRWWFVDSKGKLDFIQGPAGNVEPPRTVEEVFGFIPKL